MTTFAYNQIIEYTDGARDLNFEAARKWAAEHGTTFQEDETRREKTAGKLKRYFIIGSEPEAYNPTQEEKEQTARNKRNRKLSYTDWTQLKDAPLTAEMKEEYAKYRQYLRDYTKEEEWYEQNPKTFEEWRGL